jgi:hypothetical protein
MRTNSGLFGGFFFKRKLFYKEGQDEHFKNRNGEKSFCKHVLAATFHQDVIFVHYLFIDATLSITTFRLTTRNIVET